MYSPRTAFVLVFICLEFISLPFNFHFRDHLATILNVTDGSLSPDNGSGMDRLCIGDGSANSI